MKSMVENRGRWDAGFRSPLLRFSFLWGVPIAAMAQPGLGGGGRAILLENGGCSR